MQGKEINIEANKIDRLELAMLDHTPIDCPLVHEFTDGQYIRTICMPKGEDGIENWVTSLVHKQLHPFFVMTGKVSVFSENDGIQVLQAPYSGITKPGTRRVLLIHEDCVWITVHPTKIKPVDDSKEALEVAVEAVMEEIFLPHENTLLGGHFVNNIFYPKGDESGKQIFTKKMTNQIQ